MILKRYQLFRHKILNATDATEFFLVFWQHSSLHSQLSEDEFLIVGGYALAARANSQCTQHIDDL